MANEHARATLVDAGASAATAALAGTRVDIESAEFHLRRIVELGDRLTAARSGFEERVAGGNEADIEVGRKILYGPPVAVALETVARAAAALEELSRWTDRRDG